MNIEDIAKEDFDREISKVKAFVNSHKDNFQDILNNALKSAVRYEYTTVECNGTGGWYNPITICSLLSEVTIGEKLKNVKASLRNTAMNMALMKTVV